MTQIVYWLKFADNNLIFYFLPGEIVNILCLMVLFFSLHVMSMERPCSHEEVSIAKIALQKANIPYDIKKMRVVKKPQMKLIDVDIANKRHLIDLNSKMVIYTYVIAQRPATC